MSNRDEPAGPGRLAQARDALLAERHAVLRLYDRLVAAHLDALGPAFERTDQLLDAVSARPVVGDAGEAGGLQPILVGGTGRSGTSVTAGLLRSHPTLVGSPRELRFHVSIRRGLPALIDGTVSLERFLEVMRTFFYRRPSPRHADAEIGLVRDMTEDELERALARFEAVWVDRPTRACRDLIESVARLKAEAEPQGRVHGWVEHSPENVLLAARLHRIMPDARFVHSVRDGRDVASSVLSRNWGPDDLVTGIRWWAHRVRCGHLQTAAVPAGQTFVLHVEDLVVRDREATLSRLLDFVGIDEHPGVREAFDTRLVPENLHRGRWRTDVADSEVESVSHTYRGALEVLRRGGFPVERLLEDVPEVDDELVEREAARQELYELRIERNLLRRENAELGALVAATELIGIDSSRAERLGRLRSTLGRGSRPAAPES